MEVGTIAPAVNPTSLPISPREPPLLVYYRKGGISGILESLVVYPNGMGIYRREGEEARGEVSRETISALEMVLNLISRRGFSETSPRFGAVDFLHHEVIYPRRGERFAWVDEWASEMKLPGEVRALGKLLDYTISVVRGAGWVNMEEISTAYMRMKASLNGLVVTDGVTLTLRVSVACPSGVAVSYIPQTPDSPDVEVESDMGISVKFQRVEGRVIEERRRKLLPGRELRVEASVVLKDVDEGLHWLSIRFPPRTPSVEVSLPLLIV